MKSLNLNNNYALYDNNNNKGFSSLNNNNKIHNEKNALNQQHTFNNNFHSSLNPNDLRHGYSIQTAAADKINNQGSNNPGNIGETKKTGTFNRKFSADNQVDVSVDKSKDEQAENKSQVIMKFFLIFFLYKNYFDCN